MMRDVKWKTNACREPQCVPSEQANHNHDGVIWCSPIADDTGQRPTLGADPDKSFGSKNALQESPAKAGR